MTDYIGYDALSQAAMRGVVREALRRAKSSGGLPGEHHFYISFRTDAPGVDISERLRKQYPEEITIVLQHQFWNLEVMEDRFSVDLTFSKIPERLVVPYAAVQGFFDPSVQFGLQFEAGPPRSAAAPAPAEASAPAPAPEPASGDAAAVVSLDAFRKK